MRIARISIIIAAMTLMLVLTSSPTDGQRPPEPPRKPLWTLTGATSKVSEASHHRVASAQKLKDIWRSHLGPAYDRGDNPAPEVDFERCDLLALFEGTSVNSHGLRIEAVVDSGEVTVVRFDDISYQTLDDVNQVAPYAFVLLPKSNKVVVLEENVQRLLGHPAEWKEVARLPVPEK